MLFLTFSRAVRHNYIVENGKHRKSHFSRKTPSNSFRIVKEFDCQKQLSQIKNKCMYCSKKTFSFCMSFLKTPNLRFTPAYEHNFSVLQQFYKITLRSIFKPHFPVENSLYIPEKNSHFGFKEHVFILPSRTVVVCDGKRQTTTKPFELASTGFFCRRIPYGIPR